MTDSGENPKEATIKKTLLKLISKVAGYKVKTENSPTH